MQNAFICDAIRTPIGRYGGALAHVRTDDLGAIPLRALIERNAKVDWSAVDDVIYGCANQAGEDNRNVGRMALLLAGLPVDVPGTTVNRLCGSSMDAIAMAARAIKSGETSLMIAGGVESMSRAPFVMGKADSAFSRAAKIEDTTIGWRFVNPLMKAKYGIDSMPETAENVAAEFKVSRADQDAFALRSQQRAAAAIAAGRFADEIVPVTHARKERRPRRREPRRASARDDARVAREAERRRASRWHGDRGQCVRRQRRRVRHADRVGGRHRPPWPDAEGARRRGGSGGCRAAHHGLRPRAGDAQGAGEGRTQARRHRRDRTERSVCRAGAGRHPRPGIARRRGDSSIRTAAPSRSAIRWARAARGW